MKKSFLVAILSVIALVCAAAFFAACDKGGEEQKEFTGFTVKESAEAEAGTEYVFETPAVLCEGNKADLSVAVTFADKAVAHDGTKVYLENVGVYTITYTASYEGSTQSKSTALTSKDTTKPVIASKLPATLKMESALVLSENVSFKDKSGIRQAVFTVQDTTAETPAALREGQFDAATTRLYITDEAVKEVTVHISAEDNAGLKNERDVVIEIIPLSPYGSLTFGEAWYTASVLGGSNMPYEVTTKEDGAYTAITSTFKGSWPSFTVESESLKTLAAFDYITLRHKVEYGNNLAGWLGLGKQEYTTTYTSTDGEWTLRTWYKDNRGKPSEPEAGDAIWADLAAGRLKILPTTGQNVETTFTLAEITGGFNDIVIDKGDSIDLTAKTGLAADEFTASFRAKGSQEATTIADVSAFAPQSKGTILIAVDKEGFKETTLEIGVTFTAEPTKYGNILNLNGYDAGDAYTNVSGATATVINDSVSGGKAIKVVNNTGAGSTMAIVTISGDEVKTIANFDYLVLKVRLSCEGASANVNITITNADEWIAPNGKDYGASNGGDGTAHELRYDSVKNEFTFDSETNSFQIKLKKWNAAVQTTIITAIEGGYYDMEEDKDTPIDLTEKLGLAANEFTASFRAEGEEATPIENVTAFTPEKEGTILVTVNKTGFAEAEFEIGFLFALEPLPYGQLLFDDGFRRYTATMEGKEGSSAKEYPVTTATVGEYTAFTSTFKGGWPKFKITSEELKALANFDTITVRYKFTGGGWFGLEKDSYTTTYTTTDGEWTLRTWHRNDEYGKTGAGEAIWAALAKGELTMLPCSGTDGVEYTFTLAEITGGYYDIEAEEGQSVDLTEKFGLTAEEFAATFKPENGEAQSVTDLAAFEPTANGTLQLTVNKDGYAARQLSVNVKILTEAYGTFGFADTSRYTLSAKNGTTTYDVTETTDGDYAAIKSEITGTYPKLTIQSEDLKALANFDYITVRYKVAYSASGGSLGLKGTQGDVYNGASSTISDNGWSLATWRKDYVHPTNSNTIGEWIWDYIAQNGIIEININAWNGASTVTTLTVAEIVGGYDDVEGDGTTPIDLTAKYGAGLVRAVYTPESGDAQTLEGEALTNFTGTQSGTLQLVFSVSGCKTTTFTLNYTVQAAAQG